MRVLLVAYDNDSYIPWFPLGIAYIASVIRSAGHDVEVYNQDTNHFPAEHLTEHLDHHHYDMIGVSVIAGYYQHKKLMSISKAVNAAKNRPAYYVIGGHGPSPEPEYFLKKTGADVVVIGEGEETVKELLAEIEGSKNFATISGIAYRDGDTVTVNKRRGLIDDIDGIGWPAYDLFPIEIYRLLRMPHSANRDFIMPLLSGRGCTFTCNFCYRLDTGFRPRSSASIIEEIKYLQKDYGITYIAFADELLMSSKQRTIEICEAFLSANLNIKWDCNGRLNYADKDMLELMKRAGCVFINYGIEAFDDRILRNMNKALSTKQIERGIDNTLNAGISPGLNIIFGNIGENRETLQKGVDFLLKYDDGAQLRTIRPVTPYPGSPLYYHAIESGLLKDVDDFYTNKHLNSDLLAVNFTELTDDEYYDALMKANNTLLDNYIERQRAENLATTKKLYEDRDPNFRGFRQS